MNKTIILVFCVISLFLLSSCDVYDRLYGEETEVLPLDDVNEEVEKTLEEVLPTGEETEEETSLEEEFEEEPEEEIIEETVEEPEEIEEEFEDIFEEEITEVESEDVEPVEISDDAIAITVQETDFVSLSTQAEDPDEDTLIFTFSTPLDEDGQWQTTYGDSGEYTITVTASDGQLTTSQDVLIIVTKKEEEPTIDRFEPDTTVVSLKETEKISFQVIASDLNNDDLSYSWKLDGEDVGEGNIFTYETSYNDGGSHTIKASVTDGISTVSQLWSITVENLNRKPVLEEISMIEVRETETVNIAASASDPDGDELSFEISDPVGDDGIWETTYDDSGEYDVTVTASDGTDSVSQEVKIIVENVNRPPVIVDIIQKS